MLNPQLLHSLLKQTWEPENLFFTADTHWGHKNILKYCNRPFTSVEEMDRGLVDRWNAVVPRKGATVVHLGDLFLCHEILAKDYLKQLNFELLLWVPGNHDKVATKVCRDLQSGQFLQLPELCEIKVQDEGKEQQIVLCHYAMRVWNKSHHGAWQLYGHSHGGLPDDPTSLSMDVGVDCNDYQPFSYQQIKERMAAKSFKPIDHHTGTIE